MNSLNASLHADAIFSHEDTKARRKTLAATFVVRESPRMMWLFHPLFGRRERATKAENDLRSARTTTRVHISAVVADHAHTVYTRYTVQAVHRIDGGEIFASTIELKRDRT